MGQTIIGASNVVYGTIGDSEIIVENIRETIDGDWDELKEGDGDIVAAVASGAKGEVTMDFTIKDGSATSYLATRGSAISLPSGETNIASGKTLYLVSTEKVKSKGGWMSGSLTANYYDDLGS